MCNWHKGSSLENACFLWVCFWCGTSQTDSFLPKYPLIRELYILLRIRNGRLNSFKAEAKSFWTKAEWLSNSILVKWSWVQRCRYEEGWGGLTSLSIGIRWFRNLKGKGYRQSAHPSWFENRPTAQWSSSNNLTSFYFLVKGKYLIKVKCVYYAKLSKIIGAWGTAILT